MHWWGKLIKSSLDVTDKAVKSSVWETRSKYWWCYVFSCHTTCKISTAPGWNPLSQPAREVITSPSRNSLSFSQFQLIFYHTNIQNYLSAPSGHQSPSCLDAPALLVGLCLLVGLEIPGLEDPQVLHSLEDLAVREALSHPGLHPDGRPGNVRSHTYYWSFKAHELKADCMFKSPDFKRQ